MAGNKAGTGAAPDTSDREFVLTRAFGAGRRIRSRGAPREEFRSDQVSHSPDSLFGPALSDSSQELLLVLLHDPDKRLIFRIFVCGCPEHHFREDRREINALRRERVNQFAPVRGVSPGRDDSMSDQLLQAIRQNIRRDSLIGSQELFVGPESPQHHVAEDQQRPTVPQHLHGSIQRAPRPSIWAWLLARHISMLAFFTCILQVTCCRLAFPSRRSSIAN
jgi:hypothetical protein